MVGEIVADPVPDEELVRSAQLGDVASFGLLLARHRAGMYGAALRVLGGDADDAVQDAAVEALRRIGDLRDPLAVGKWLQAITRNSCLTQLRRRSAVPVGDTVLLRLPAREPTPEEVLDRHASRDWLWHALGQLTPALQMVTLLRYFTEVTSYESIATVCGIPVGTVRSRLSQARGKLAAALLASAAQAHPDVNRLAAAQRRDADEAFEAANAGRFAEVMKERYSPALETHFAEGSRGRGIMDVDETIAENLSDGIRARITNVVGSAGLLIWEAEFICPPDVADLYPPSIVWLQTMQAGQIRRLRTFHNNAPRPAALDRH